MARNDHPAASCRLLRIVQVLGRQPGLLVRLVEDIRVFILADTAKVDDARVGQHVLGAAGGVLGGAAGQEFGLAVVDEFVVERHVLILGEDGIVGFELILLEECVVPEMLVSK